MAGCGVVFTQPHMHTCAWHTPRNRAAHASHHTGTGTSSEQNQHGVWFPGPKRLLGESGQAKQSNRTLVTDCESAVRGMSTNSEKELVEVVRRGFLEVVIFELRPEG